MAADAVTFIRALGLPKVDLLGFSMGGMVAQVIAQDEPELVIAGTGPAGGGGIKNVAGISHLYTIRALLKAGFCLGQDLAGLAGVAADGIARPIAATTNVLSRR